MLTDWLIASHEIAKTLCFTSTTVAECPFRSGREKNPNRLPTLAGGGIIS